MSDAKVTKRLSIHGRVQGVYFRDSMRQRALQLDVTGWVRNRMDGTVQAMVSGDPGAVSRMIEWARRGPATAKVTAVQVEEAQGHFDSFDLLPTT
jgi:acylphosphatase